MVWLALLALVLGLFHASAAMAQTQRPASSALQWRYIGYDYAASRGATFKLVQSSPPCPYTIRQPEALTDSIEVSIDCRLRPTRGRFDFRFFENHTLNTGWIVHHSDIGYRWNGVSRPGQRGPRVGFTRQPPALQRNPRMDIFVETPPNAQVFVRVRLLVQPGLLVAGQQHSNPLFNCERAETPAGPLAIFLPRADNTAFRCTQDSDCAAGFTCGHPVCGANLCSGPRTGPG